MSLTSLPGILQQQGAAGAPDPDVGWWDASVTASITTGVSTATRVTEWEDQTASGFDLTNTPVSANCPIYDGAYGSLTQNSVLIPRFVSGTFGDVLSYNGAVLAPNLGAMSIYAVVAVPGSSDGVLLADGSSTDNDTVYALRQKPSLVASWLIREDDGTALGGTTPDTGVSYAGSEAFCVQSFVDTGSAFETWIDGSHPVDADNPKTYSSAGLGTTDRFSVGGLLRATFSIALTVNVAEIRVYGSAHGTATRQAVESALETKWAI